MQTDRAVSGHPILLVEDEPRLREMLIQGTRDMGFLATGVGSAEQALRLLDKQTYPVIIIDLNLPGMGGLDLLRETRQRWPEMQAIILTGFGDLQAARDAIHLEVIDFLTKPCALGELELAISRALRRHQQLQPLGFGLLLDEEEASESIDGPAAAPVDESGETMEDLERKAILATVRKHGGNRAAAASELGISIRKLYYRLGQYRRNGFTD